MQGISIKNFLQQKNETISQYDQLMTDHLIILQCTDTVQDAIRKFSGAKILAAPVVFQMESILWFLFKIFLIQ